MNSDDGPLTWVQVLNYQGSNCLAACLDSLLEREDPLGRVRLVVVDNASTDGSREMLARLYPQVEVVQSTWNRGYAAGNNLGLRQALEARADYAFLLNMDARVAPSCLRRLVDVAQQRPEAALLGATLYTADGERVEFDGRQFDPVLTAGGYADTPRRPGAESRVNRAAYACGAAMLIRLDVSRQVGLFSETFFAYHEDVELSLRARLFGHEVLTVSDAVVYHARGGAGAGERFRDFMGTRNMLLTLLEVYDRASWISNAEALFDHFLGRHSDAMRSAALLAALSAAPSVLRQRRRIRAVGRKSYRQVVAALAARERSGES